MLLLLLFLLLLLHIYYLICVLLAFSERTVVTAKLCQSGIGPRVQTFICPFVRGGQTNARATDLLGPHPKGKARLDLIDLFNFHKTPRQWQTLPRFRPRPTVFPFVCLTFRLSNCLSVRPCELASSSKFAISISAQFSSVQFQFQQCENGLYSVFFALTSDSQQGILCANWIETF